MSEPLLKELRAAKPAAPPELRERVRAIAAAEPARPPFLARLRSRFGWPVQRNRLLVVVPAALVVAAAVAGVIGLSREDVGGADERAASGDAAVTTQLFDANRDREATEESLKTFGAPVAGSSIVPPASGRLQRYEAELRLRVDDVEALSG